MDRLDQFLGVSGMTLKLRAERMEILASNIANAATPGFRARDLDFARLLGAPVGPSLAATRPAHFQAGTPEAPRLAYRLPVQPSLDGNTVELATEQVQFTETALRYRATLSVLNGRISTLTSAMKGE